MLQALRGSNTESVMNVERVEKLGINYTLSCSNQEVRMDGNDISPRTSKQTWKNDFYTTKEGKASTK